MTRVFLFLASATVLAVFSVKAEEPKVEAAVIEGPVAVCPGVWRFTIGTPEKVSPVTMRHYGPAMAGFTNLPAVGACPVAPTGSLSARGCLVSLPLPPDEKVYGLGLQLRSLEQRGHKKTLRVNADPVTDSGDSHAPVPFYVTTGGYGVLVDTARYATFYCGNTQLKPEAGEKSLKDRMLVEVPEARGVDVYVFAGPSLRQAVQRYNLFSGGGVLPPRWGLGFWYRCDAGFDQASVLNMANALRDEKIPCDVLGLEPGWQSRAYSCSFVWNSKFSSPSNMLATLQQKHYHVNLWEHAFVNPASPLYQPLLPHSGDYEVWNGLVPDFLDAAGRKIFGGYHDREFVAIGVSGFKLDECDNSDFTGGWSFPEMSRFSSGADGEQMHSLFGLHYQDTIQGVFDARHQRTYGLVRSSGALAAPYPYVLYSDLYDHSQFIHGVPQAGFCGLLWTPEVREAGNPEELIRRLQSTVFSPLAMINAWYLKNPPWKQVDRTANNEGRFSPDADPVEAQCRAMIELRMKWVPYLHAAFVRYQREGLPPFRAVVMDYPDTCATKNFDGEYMMGDSVLVAPVSVSEMQSNGVAAAKSVSLPPGEWQDFWTGQHYRGQQAVTLSVPLERVPIFVKSGAILPLAQPTLSTEDPDSWKLTALVFGNGSRPTTLYEDDGSFEPQLNSVRLEWNAPNKSGRVTRSSSVQPNSYSVIEWKVME